MTTEQSRREFEEWLNSQYPDHNYAKKHPEFDEYYYPTTRFMLDAYQASRASLLAVLESPEMKQGLHDALWDRGYNSNECVSLVELAIATIVKKLKGEK